MIFCIFSNGSNSASNFAFYDTHVEQKKIELLILALVANENKDESAEKKRKTFFINVSYNPILHIFPAWGLHFVKKVKIVVPYCTGMDLLYLQCQVRQL